MVVAKESGFGCTDTIPPAETPSPIVTTEISWTETDAEKGTTVSMPHFGGIMTSEFDGKTIIFAWSGSDPDSDT
jgi:hypothetical protein